MKVLFTLDSLGNAGTEKSTLDILSHFSRDIDVKVIYFYPGDHLKKAYEDAGIALQFVNVSGRMSILKGINRLKKIIKDERPDVVVSSILRANLISRIACKQTNTKIIGTFVSDSYSSIRKKSFSFKRRVGFYFYYQLDRFTARIPCAWVSNSECIKKSNCRFLQVDPGLVKVIYRGRDPQKFISKEKTPSKGIFRFVYVGRLLQTKGLYEMLLGFKIVSETYPAVSLDIYGEGNLRNNIIQQIAQAGLQDKVTLHGAVPNGWEKLYEADCFIFPSWNEGFSGSLVEAMMVGIPIIASDIPMNLEAVTNNETALIHKVKDAESIGANMKAMIGSYDKMREMGMRARVEALKRFDIRAIAKEYQEYITTV